MALRFKVVPKNTMVYEITGPMFFAAADKFLDINIAPGVKVLVLRMRGVPAMDVTALRSLRKIYANCKKRGITLLLSHVNEQPFTMMAKAGFVAEVGEDNFCENIDAALEKAATIK
jgi:SulP family sulfate permease